MSRLEAHPLRFTDAHLLLGSRALALDDVEEVFTEHHPPRLLAAVCVLVLSAAALILAIAFSVRDVQLSGLLILPAVLFFGSMWSLLGAEDCYVLVLQLRGGKHALYRSSDHQLVVRRVALIDEALRLRRAPRR